MKKDMQDRLQQEREKLNQMVEEALKRHEPIAGGEIQKQSRLVETLLEPRQRELV